MSALTPKNLMLLLENHRKWLRSEKGGVRAILTDANLTDAILTVANLMGAVLTRANLTRAVLTGANLTDANLRGANLTRTILTRAVLRGTNLTDAVLTGAVLTDANLTRADLTGAILTGAVLRDADIPAVSNIDTAILDAIGPDFAALDMGSWHSQTPCGTTHCRAGWAVILAGDAGVALERKIGTAAAGALIYAASRSGKPIPDFYADNKTALADIRASAEMEAQS